MYDDIWTVEQAREAIEQGHRLYTLGPEDAYAPVELSGEGIRAASGDSGDDRLVDLPSCR
jgi:hypothetical protein